jgi:hypothetical protein
VAVVLNFSKRFGSHATTSVCHVAKQPPRLASLVPSTYLKSSTVISGDNDCTHYFRRPTIRMWFHMNSLLLHMNSFGMASSVATLPQRLTFKKNKKFEDVTSSC